jgi:hypothetical protein
LGGTGVANAVQWHTRCKRVRVGISTVEKRLFHFTAMNHIALTTIIILLTGTFSFAQSKDDTIVWTPNYKLKWEDFQGKSKEFMNNIASTRSTFSFSYKVIKNKYEFSTKAFFDKKKSWVSKGFEDVEVLVHEQTHFDITAMHALSLLHILKSRNYTSDSVERKTKKTYDSMLIKMYHMQRQYDLETLHGTKEAQQQVWSKKIDNTCRYYVRLLK